MASGAYTSINDVLLSGPARFALITLSTSL